MNTETPPAGTTQTPLTGHANRPITSAMSKHELMEEIALWKGRYEAVHEECDRMEKSWAGDLRLKDELVQDIVDINHRARSLELALAASKAREAELVKALEVAKEDIEWSCGQLNMNPRDHTAWRVIDAALTAPPTNSKEMKK